MKGEEVKWEAENRKTEETSETCERDGSEPKSEDVRVTEKTCHNRTISISQDTTPSPLRTHP